MKWFQVLLCITKNSIKHQSFVYPQLNDRTLLFLTIQFSRSHLFALSLNGKQIEPYQVLTTPGQSGAGSDGNEELLRIL